VRSFPHAHVLSVCEARERRADVEITGYDDYQIYLLLSCAPIQGHIAGIVDVPNACTTIGLPMDIFDFDIRPETKAEKRELGVCAFASS
jgi:formamidase